MAKPLEVVLLGATGFTGSSVLRILADVPSDEVRVHALVREPSRLDAPPKLALRVFRGDISQPPVELFPKDPHVLIHLATKQLDADGTGFECNVEAARTLVHHLPESTQAILYGSSASVYGQGSHTDLDESVPLLPESPLARSRLATERVILDAARVRQITAYCLRPRFILGRGDRYTMPGLVKMVRGKVQPGSGAQRYTIIDVEDYANMFVALSRRSLELSQPEQDSLNAGYTQSVSMDQIVTAICRHFKLRPPSLRIPVWGWLTRTLHRTPVRAADTLATRLELFGLSHVYRVDNLRRRIGNGIVGRDPVERIDSIAARAAMESISRKMISIRSS